MRETDSIRCESLQIHNDEVQKDQFISEDEASKQLLGSKYAVRDIGVDNTDPLGFKGGEQVAVEMTDAEPGTYPQKGRLVGLNKMRIVVELDNGVRIHFPRIGYLVNKDTKSNGHA